MCGILGCVSGRVDGVLFDRALAELDHRGPFDRGQAEAGALRLGMTRLPMSSCDDYPLPPRVDGWLASYNGEVYRGAVGGLPAEIGLLIDALRGGGDFPDGMYAFALLEPSGERLHLGRDALGIKPLYYWHDPDRGEFAFASELPALLRLLGPRKLDRASAADVAATGAVLGYRTMFEGIRLLPPGTLLSLDMREPLRAPRLSPLRTAAAKRDEGLEEALAASVAQCSHTFRDVGLLLSGGIDSNLLNSYLSDEAAKFHVEVADSEDHPGQQRALHVCRVAGGDFWVLARRAVRNFSAPTRMSSILMYQELAELVRRHGYYCVLLGEGADELFWGYPRHLAMAERGFELTPRQLAAQYFGDFSAKAAWLAPELEAAVLARVDEATGEMCLDGLDEAVWRFDLHYSLEPLLRRADHLLMSQTIEARLPFLHGGVPARARGLGRARLEGLRQKAPLQELIRRRLPSYPIEKKRHFRLPFSQWPGVVDEMRGFLLEGLGELHDLGLVRLSPDAVRSMAPGDAFTLTTLLLWRQAFSEHLQ
ncbi:asparagine synthetase B [Chromobacterium amazonense]|uniref:asparagine synthetase B family protein n=1 Tax=Chromobacterium amazonense TaxID=1382803 RepID=UPI0031F6FA47